MTINRWAALVDTLIGDGKITEMWQRPFLAVQREQFIPDMIWVIDPAGRGFVPLRKADEPDAWRSYVNADEFIVTQVDDGAPARPEGIDGYPTSSSSMPSVMAAMLAWLDLRPGQRVLEIGTSTGYNTALLCEYLGDDTLVTTVEIDPDIAEHAEKALTTAGYRPTVVCADGEQGWPGRAPYDRVLSTAGVNVTVPYPWIEQTRPGGVIITPWATPYLDSALVRLGVDTGVASGSFCGNAVFMNLRGHRRDRAVPRVDYTAAEKSYTLLHPWYASEDSTGFAFTVSVLLPDLQQDIAYDPDDRSDYELLVWDSGGSWAAVNIDNEHRQAGRFFVRQRGFRRLWNEVERAFAWWILNGKPTYHRFGLNVTADRQWVWLDIPDHEITGVFPRGATRPPGV
ncbi:MAG: methyltransferase domain-containing protein [Pseudonocardiaceae bacterium]